MKRNLLTITMLVLCLVIGFTLVAVPASAQEFYCYGTEEVTLIDEPNLELIMKCEGDRLWGMYIENFYIGDQGEAELFYIVVSEDYEVEEFIGEYSWTISNILKKQENRLDTVDGDRLEVLFQFK